MKIIIMALDTLRYDHLGCDGYSMETSPAIDSVADEGVVFDRHYSTDVPTPPGYTAMLTGKRGQHTGIFGFGQTNYEFSTNGSPMLASVLAEAGHRTGMISNLLYVCPWLTRGFHEIIPPGLRFQGGTAEEVTGEACRWLDRNHADDFFLFVHYWDPHQNYFKRAPQEYQQRFFKKDYSRVAPDGAYFKKSPLVYGIFKQYSGINYGGSDKPAEYMPAYDACIRYMDDHIGDLIEHMKKLGIDEETILVITSDHGEAFGERGFYDHMSCYENISHVPLIIRWPKAIPAGKHVSGYSLGVDLMPTLLEFCKLPQPEKLCGRSLVPTLLKGEPTSHQEVVTDSASIPIQRMYIRDDWALVHTIDKCVYEYLNTYELFNLASDRAQETDLAAKEPERVAAMRSDYDRWLDRELAGQPDKLLGIPQRGGGWGTYMVMRAFYDDPDLYFSNPALRSFIVNRLGSASVEYHKRHTQA